MLGSLILFLLVAKASAEECLTPGITHREDLAIARYLDVYDAYVCRDYCLADANCRAFTFYDNFYDVNFGTCILFGKRNAEQCENCLSGTRADCTCGSSSVECLRDDQNENLLASLPSSSELECKTLCQQFQGCAFYTWLDASNQQIGNSCFLYSSCNQVSACSGCSSGPAVCQSDCPKYRLLDSDTRNVEYGNGDDDNRRYCDDNTIHEGTSPDWEGPGWYRMLYAGTQLPEVSPGMYHCGTVSPGWLNGQHNPILGNQVQAQVCFDEGYECLASIDITIRSCGGYYLYNLPTPPYCTLRYCTVV